MNILKKIALINLKLNKKRTIATITGIILSTSLMIGIGLIISSVKESIVRQIITEEGTHHAILYNLNKEQIEKLNNFEFIKEIKFSNLIGNVKNGDEYYNLIGIDEKIMNSIKLKTGRLPKNDREVLILGDRNHLLNTNNIANLEFLETISTDCGESSFKETGNIEKYEIVGLVEAMPIDRNKYICNLKLLTMLENESYDAYIEYSEIKDARNKTKIIMKSLGVADLGENFSYNSALLEIMGEHAFINIDMMIVSMMVITLSVIAIGCTIVTYNSFAISIIERKRQFGILNSIGATKKQIKKSVYYETSIIGSIGIMLGIVGAFVGIGILVLITNHLLAFSDMTFKLHIYPLYIVIPILFMILVIAISSIVPAILASKLNPIENIRMKNDIKNKKVKTSKILRFIFGIEGVIAFKNMKRNKKKYRITLLALVASMTMFIVFSSYIKYFVKTVDIASLDNTYNLEITNYEYSNKESIDKSLKKLNLNDYVIIKNYNYFEIVNFEKLISSKYKETINNSFIPNTISINTINEEKYDYLLKKYNQEEGTIFVNNYFRTQIVKNNMLKLVTLKKYNEAKDLELRAINYHLPNDGEVITNDYTAFTFKLKNLHYINEKEDFLKSDEIIMNEETFLNLKTEIEQNNINNYSFKEWSQSTNMIENTYIKTSEGKGVKEELETVNPNLIIFEPQEEKEMIIKIVSLIKILIYGFVSLIAAIGITSMFNTLNTSIILRKREFAMLRSVGMSEKGLNKMMIFETVLFSLKTTLYSIPISLLLITIIHNNMSSLIITDQILLPFEAMIASIIFLVLIVYVIIKFSIRKIKSENILEALREENI